MSDVDLQRDGDVAVLRMAAGENRFNPTTLAAINGALDEVEAIEGPRALVITGEGKFFSNGLDLEWMGSAPEGGPQEVIDGVHGLLARLLEFPGATVAACNGHVFAAGAMLAIACDSRVMRDDRGFFCLPEVDLGLSFTPGMAALLLARLAPQTAHEAMVTGRRYGAADALAAGIVDATAPEDRVVADAVERAAALAAKPAQSQQAIKRAMYGPALEALRTPAVLPGL